ncbi:MAG: hypothetical protein KBA28_05275 [Syntrophaceae bacterium]|nr:hypothetical protein [Syntrophaceae bacterium]
MLKHYEAIYQDGKLLWIYPPPFAIENRRVTVFFEDAQDDQKAINVKVLLKQTQGTLDQRMTMEEIDTDVRAMRDEWTRNWDHS